MLRDVFYYGSKPNVHPREKFATSIEDARQQCTTEHFWIINEQCDYQNFDWDWDFEFLPDEDVWAEEHNNVWPSFHQKTSGTWLCPKQYSKLIIYRADVDPLKRKNIKNDNWVLLDLVDETKFDFSWHPDPTEPPFIYVWGNKWNPVELQPVLEYHTPYAFDRKYMDQVVELLPNEHFKEIIPIDKSKFDLSWRPDPREPPFVYVWGSKWNEAAVEPVLAYYCVGATDKKYLDTLLDLLPNKTNWEIPDNIDTTGFDFTWRPNPTSPPYIYQFGTQWQKTGGPRYVVENAIDIKYIDDIKAVRLSNKENWKEILPVTNFDYSWHPDDTDPPFVYVWGSKWNEAAVEPVLAYYCVGATERKYMSSAVDLLPNKTNWEIPDNIDTTGFDFTWRPNPTSPPYIYQFGTQWQKTGGPKYVVENAIDIKYIDIQKAVRLSNKENWKEILPVTNFDYSWHPDDTDPPFVYVWGSKWNEAAVEPVLAYYCPGATDKKYLSNDVELLPNKTNWEIPDNIDTTGFDFSWRPNPTSPPYIYQFGTQWQKTGGPKYVVEDAIDIKYIDFQKAKILSNKENWKEILPVTNFDYSWHPDDTEPPFVYVWGSKWNEAAVDPSIGYYVPGATERKYMTGEVELLPDQTNWEIPDNIDTTGFDFTWRPNPTSPPYIYQFGTQWQKTNGPRYVVEDATEIKYVDDIKAVRLSNKENWKEILPVTNFDYSWHPDDTDPPFVYVWGSKWNEAAVEPVLEYHTPYAFDRKYMDQVVELLPNEHFKEIIPIDKSKFDLSWRPDTREPPFVYVWGSKWNEAAVEPVLAYYCPGATDKKYLSNEVELLPNKTNWEIPIDIDINKFDFSWRPNPTSPPYIYQFGTQWQKTNGPRYVVEDATEIKYVDDIKAVRLATMVNWKVSDGIDVSNFDFSWHPDDTSPPFVYRFGTILDRDDGPRYLTPDNTGESVYMERIVLSKPIEIEKSYPKYLLTTSLEDLIKQHPDEIFWALNPRIDYTNFNFDWKPSIEQAQYIQAFGSSESETTQTYLVNSTMWEKGFRELNWVVDKKLDDETLFKMFKKSDMFFVDRSNNESKERFEKLKQKFPDIQRTRYLNSWVDTINRCINRSTTELCWILNSELDYTEFNFEYYPNPWQMKMIQVFGTQWSHWGTTYLVNRETFAQDTKYIKIIEHLSNLNFVKERKATARNVLYDIIYIDHGNTTMSARPGNIVIKYQGSYITTLQKMLEVLPIKKEHYVWVASTVCDYTDFDFTYICDPFAKEHLHVFPSDGQKFGDTFLVDVNKLRVLIQDMNSLLDYGKINYNQNQRAKRLAAPVFITENDTHITSINTDFNFPYAIFKTSDNIHINIVNTEPISLWSAESKTIEIHSVGGTCITIPKEAKNYIKNELYDYPYILSKRRLIQSAPLDIIFFSNGEQGADLNYEHLLSLTRGLPNKVLRIDKINGRVKSQHAAASSSTSPWYFLVNAKLKVNSKFDFNWQPDRLQIPKHYIFHAKNPVNGLVYGHQAIVANNKKLTLANFGTGLDFTMDSEHEVVEINSGVGIYNTSEWDTWRTAFRECIKLKASSTVENIERLESWLSIANGDYAEYSLLGAKNAIEYYETVNGDFDKLRLSYDWMWLKEQFNKINIINGI